MKNKIFKILFWIIGTIFFFLVIMAVIKHTYDLTTFLTILVFGIIFIVLIIFYPKESPTEKIMENKTETNDEIGGEQQMNIETN